MTSALVKGLIERAGLLPLLAERERGVVPAKPEVSELLARAELLALGAAADLARRRECGDEARIHIPSAPLPSDTLVVVGRDDSVRGTALLRRIAAHRLTGPIGLRIVVDFGALGLEIAQVALSFGATDLAGPIASRRGLPLVDRDDQKKLVKRREIAAYVERAGLRPVFVITEAHQGDHAAPAGASPRHHVDS